LELIVYEGANPIRQVAQRFNMAQSVICSMSSEKLVATGPRSRSLIVNGKRELLPFLVDRRKRQQHGAAN
jgi:hypothetical protein